MTESSKAAGASPLVERVARALCEDCGLDWETATQEGWERQARAAIAAMREPTEAMLEAGRSTPPRTRCLEVYRAMIDEALK